MPELEEVQSSPPRKVTRRRVLKALLQASAATGAALLGIQIIPQLLDQRHLDVLFSLDPQTPLPEHLLTSLQEFYIQSYALPPRVNLETWRLEIRGTVTSPLTLTFDDIINTQPQTDFHLTMECIGNPAGGNLIGNARWTGTPLLPFLQRAGIQPTTQQIVLHGADSYETTLPLTEILRPEVMLVHRMNGEPLNQDHGYPLRIIIPGHYGQKQPKWLVGIEAIATRKQGFWERQGWSDTATIPTHALTRQVQSTRVWNRHRRVTLAKAGTEGWGNGLLIAGVALDSKSPIQRISVSTDSGNTWQQVEQNQPDSPHEWTLWRHLWRPQEPGTYTLLARAETSQAQQPLNDRQSRDGSSGILRIQVDLQA